MTHTQAKGFTLIELMIVVAIIGLLAALAIPNFLKFQARARQSEVKSNLKAFFTAEKAYYGDKQLYIDLFDVVGFSPEWANRYAYFAGAGSVDLRNSPGVAPPAGSPSATCPTQLGIGTINSDQTKYPGTGVGSGYGTFVVGNRVANAIGYSAGATTAGVVPAATCCPQGVCEFLAEAVANIDNDSTLDGWAVGSQGSTSTGDSQACGSATWSTGTFAEGEPVNECNDVAL